MRIDTLKITEIIVMDKADVITRADGSIMANPRVGRIGIQLYQGKELGRNDMEVVRVFRPEDQVMAKQAMSSVTHRPVTNDHPPEPVTADNWKKYAVGHTGDTVARDGDYIRVPMMLSDGGAIKDFTDGKKELSLGYTSQLEWREGMTPQGEKYDAVQSGIRVNHLALVDAARGGPKLAIGDSLSIEQDAVDKAKQWIADGKFDRKSPFASKTGDVVLVLASSDGVGKYSFAKDGKVFRTALESIKAQAVTNQEASVVALADELMNLIDQHKDKRTMDMKSYVIDGITVELSDIAASVVMRRIKNLETEAGDLHTKLSAAALKAKAQDEKNEESDAKFKKKGETDAATIATLQQQLTDAAMTPAKLDALVRDRSETAVKGKLVMGDKFVSDGKTVSEMRRQVVDAKLGEASKGWSDDAITASFATLTAGITQDAVSQHISSADALRNTFKGAPAVVDDGAKARANYNTRLQDAWKTPAGAA